jgi:hypothetical protein
MDATPSVIIHNIQISMEASITKLFHVKSVAFDSLNFTGNSVQKSCSSVFGKLELPLICHQIG